MASTEIGDVISEMRDLRLAGKSAVELQIVGASSKDGDFFLKVEQHEGEGVGGKLASLCSTNHVRIFDAERLIRTDTIQAGKAKDSTLNFNFSRTSSPLLYLVSSESVVRCYDFRKKISEPCMEYKGSTDQLTNYSSKPQFISVSVSNDGKLAAGTKVMGDSPFLNIWDIRTTEPVNAFNDLHSDDITGLSFDAVHSNRLLSTSDDSMVNYLDLSETREEDVLQQVFPFPDDDIGSSIGWTRDERAYIVNSAGSDLYIWDCIGVMTELQKDDIEQKNVRNIPPASDQSNIRTDFIVDCFISQNKLFAVTGNENGTGFIYNVKKSSKLKPLDCVLKSHSAPIRSCAWNEQSRCLYTVGEDSLLCAWRHDDIQTDKQEGDNSKSVKPRRDLRKEKRMSNTPYKKR